MRKLFKVLLAIVLTGLVNPGCALRPRFNDLVAKEETAKELRFRVVDAETKQPILGASVEMGDGKYKFIGISDAEGVVKLPVNKRYRDDNAVVAVTLASGLPRYELVRLEGMATTVVGETEASVTVPPVVGAPAEGKKGLDFKPSNSANGLVVLYRNTSGMMGSGSMLGVTVKVNGEAVGDLPHDTYVVVELAPGKHTVTALSAAGESNWVVQVAAGAVQYAQLEPMPFRLQAKASEAALTEMRADAETLSLSVRANLGAPAAAPVDPNVKQM